MVKKMKKPLALFLALVMCLGMVNFTAFAEEPTQEQNQIELNGNETPAEVQVFLDAVAAIPAITAENAAEVAEYVYGPVSDAYDALLDTELMERADVQEAEAAYAAAIETVDAVLNIEEPEIYATNISVYDNTLAEVKSSFYNLQITGNSVNKSDDPRPRTTIWVNDNATVTFTPVRGIKCKVCNHWMGGGIFAPTKYCEINATNNAGLISDPTFGKGTSTDSQAGYTQCLEMRFTGVEPGITNIPVSFYCNFELYYNKSLGDNGGSQMYCAYCYNRGYLTNLGVVYNDATWHKYYNWSAPVTVYARYQLNYNLNGGTGSIASTYDDVANTTATLGVTSAKPADWTKDGKTYTFKGWSETSDGKTPVGSVSLNWSTGLGGKNNPVEKTLYAIWEDAETYTVTYTDGVEGEIVFPDQGYEGLKEGDNTPKFVGTPSRTGYTFMGWAPAVAEKVTEDVTYVATWKKNETTYKVIYSDGLGGRVFGDEGHGNLKAGDATPACASNTDRKGFTFVGWMLNGTLLSAVHDKVLAADANKDGEIIYTAQWKKNYDVTYTWDGLPDNHGQTLPTGGTYAEDAEVTVNDTYTSTTEVTVGGTTYVFSGWAVTVPAGITIANGKFTMPNENVTISGTWSTKTTEKPNLEFEKLALVSGDVIPGQEIKYMITVRNLGSTAVKNVVITDVLDSNLEFVKAEGTNGLTLVGPENKPADNQYVLGDLAAKNVTGDNKALTITVRVKDGATGIIHNTASATCGGMTAGDEPSDSADVTVKGPEYSLEVNKDNNGGLKAYTDPNVTADAYVKYTVTVKNTSEVNVYGLRLTDVMTPTPAAAADGLTYTFKDWKVNGTAITPTSGDDTDLTHTLWLVDRNTEFAKGATVTLTYTVDIVNNSDADIEVKLKNDATGAIWDKMKAEAPNTPAKIRKLAAPMPLADDDDDAPITTGSGSSTTGGTAGGTETGGKIPGKKTVTYSWTGLPDGTTEPSVPATVKYKKGATVTVDTTFTSASTTTVNGALYTFSGWSKTGTFTIEDNETITGTWTKHEHSWTRENENVWATDPDCITDGTAWYVCSCGEREIQTVPNSKLGHDFTNATAVDNCTDHHDENCTGHTLTCTRCNGSLTGGIKTEVHSYPETWTEKTAATIEAAGVEHRFCTVCGHEQTRPTDKLKVNVIFKDGDNVLKTIPDWDKDDEVTPDLFPELPTAPEGKEFDQWVQTIDPNTGDIIYTIQWKDKTYTVTFDSQGGSTVASQTVKHGETVAQLPVPTRTNYTFNGWNTAADGTGTAFTAETAVIDNITVYAQWTYVPPYIPTPDYTYTLNYNANGGVGAPASQSQTNDRNFTVSAVEPTREGYTFAGWALTADAETAAYQAGGSIRVTGYSLTLYAVWTPVEEDVEETQTPTTETPETTEPTETPDEGEDLGDNDTPLTDLPEPTETQEPEPEETPEPDESEELGDNDTPLADVPQTGDSIGLWIVLALCSAAGLYCFFPRKKGQREA